MPALSGGMILYSSRSAKSVACSKLNVIGVSAFFFLPVFVAAFTRTDEFHSVTNTRWPSADSHFASSPSCVVFPEPSMPSTTNSLPGYSCGVVSMFSMRSSGGAHLDTQRFADQPFEFRGVSRRGPQLQLGVTGRPQLQKSIISPIVHVEAGNRLRVAAVEAFGQAEHGGEDSDRFPPFFLEIPELLVAALGRGLPMIPRDEPDELDFVRLESAQVAVGNQVVRVLVMALVADMHADVVEQGGVLEPLALAIGEPVDAARLIEQLHGEARHLLRVLRPVVAAFGQLEHAAPPDVGITIGLDDLFPVPRDVVEDQALAQRQIAQRDLAGAEPPHQCVEQDAAGDGQVRATRLEPGDFQPLLQVARDERLARP